MTFVKSASVIAAATLALCATAASAAPAATTINCVKMESAVASAISANQSSANLKAAKSEQSAGSHFCHSNLYDKGVAHYQAALDLLGVK